MSTIETLVVVGVPLVILALLAVHVRSYNKGFSDGCKYADAMREDTNQEEKL